MTKQSAFQIKSPEPDFYTFTCWNADVSGCGVFSVRGVAAMHSNKAALEKLGCIDRSGQNFDYTTRSWREAAAS